MLLTIIFVSRTLVQILIQYTLLHFLLLQVRTTQPYHLLDYLLNGDMTQIPSLH